MLYRSAPVMVLPACVTLLCALNVNPPKWMVRPVVPVPAPKPVVELPKPKVIIEPELLAVDRRIANRVNQLRPTVKDRLRRVAKKLPRRVKILVTSAYRTRKEQASLRPTFGVKARPGSSPHEDGRAIDVNVLVDGKRISPRRQNKVIGAAMASEGFKYLGAIDPVHYSVPKDAVDPNHTAAADLQVMTMVEIRELQEEINQPAVPTGTAIAAQPVGTVQPVAAAVFPGTAGISTP